MDLNFSTADIAALDAASKPDAVALAELEEAGDEVVNDAVGELTNMTVGVFKNRIHDLGYPCKLTIPTVVWGSHIAIQPPRGAVRRTYTFQVDGRSVIADLMFKND